MNSNTAEMLSGMTSEPPSTFDGLTPPCLCVQVESLLPSTPLLPGAFFFAMLKGAVINDEVKDWVVAQIGGEKDRFYIATLLRDGGWISTGRETLDQLITNEPLMTPDGMVQFRVLPREVHCTKKEVVRWYVNGDEVGRVTQWGEWW